MSAREELFARALAGDLAWDADELELLRRESPEEARALDGLLALQGTLEARESRGEAAPTAADLALVSGALDRLRAEGGACVRGADGPRPVGSGADARRALPGLLRLAAAVLLIAVGGWWWSSESDDTSPEGVRLGAIRTFEAVVPVGRVDSFFEFRLRVEFSPMDTLELRIWDADDAADAPARVTRRFSGSACSLTDDEQQRLGTRIRWQVVVRDAEGRRIGSTELNSAERASD